MTRRDLYINTPPHTNL